ncbi:MAG TPA: hypothetical protein VKA87_08120 [Nitrososphaeraceae archaeon]|nr:hypothetical protein [Nitrososphaeraceae archaeon]
MAKIGFSPFSNHNTDSRSERPNYYDALFFLGVNTSPQILHNRFTTNVT